MSPGLLFNYFILALFLWAIIDAATRQKAAFDWAGTMGKWQWVLLLIAAGAFRAGLLTTRIPFGFIISLACFVLVVYYLGSIKPKLDELPRRGNGRGRGNSGRWSW